MPYIDVPDYVRRFGARETIDLTNEMARTPGQTAQYDEAKIDEALEDQSQTVDAYIGTRYTTPLENAPPIVRGWVAALAREQLATNTGRVSEAIRLAADRARADLRDLSARKLNLPIPEGEDAPAPVDGGAPMILGDRISPTFTNDVLNDFTSAFTGGSSLPCWRR